MTHRSKEMPLALRRMSLAAFVSLAFATISLPAQAASEPVAKNMAIPNVAPSALPPLTQHVMELIKQKKLVELRTIYNGPFAAAMFFNPSTLEYTDVLLKHQTFWWIGQTTDGKKAEMLYTKLATQTIRLAAPDLAKIQLDARIAMARRTLQAEKARQEELSSQIAAQQRIVQAGASAQRQLAEEASALNARRQALESELQNTTRAISQLQQQSQSGPDFQDQESEAPVPVAPIQPKKPKIRIQATAHP
jgi:flagellar biosynthesis GTPase FlhF